MLILIDKAELICFVGEAKYKHWQGEAMDVFISWSGEASHVVGLALKDWLPSVIQSIEPFISSEDISKGSRWFSEIGVKLDKSNFGIICLTPENSKEPWILFEAGAISKSIGESCVAPVLLGMSISELEGPIAQFNATLATKEDLFKLIKSINEKIDTTKDKKLEHTKLEKIYDALWPELEEKIKECNRLISNSGTGSSTAKLKRTTEDILEELIELGRSNTRLLSELPNTLIKELDANKIADSQSNKERNRIISDTKTKTLMTMISDLSTRAAIVSKDIFDIKLNLESLKGDKSKITSIKLLAQLEDREKTLALTHAEMTNLQAELSRLL